MCAERWTQVDDGGRKWPADLRKLRNPLCLARVGRPSDESTWPAGARQAEGIRTTISARDGKWDGDRVEVVGLSGQPNQAPTAPLSNERSTYPCDSIICVHSGQAPRSAEASKGTSQSVNHDTASSPQTVVVVPTSLAWTDPMNRADDQAEVLVNGPVTKNRTTEQGEIGWRLDPRTGTSRPPLVDREWSIDTVSPYARRSGPSPA